MTNYTEEAHSKVFKDNGVIFAFSQKQFDEQKVAGVKYVEMGSGDLCPKENVKKYLHEAGLAIDSGIKKVSAECFQDAVNNDWF